MIPMNSTERINIIQQRLEKAFSPQFLDVIDDSHKHVGHAGSQGGAGHYTVVIEAECFKNQSRVEAHRSVYAVLEDLIPNQIHALRIVLNRSK